MAGEGSDETHPLQSLAETKRIGQRIRARLSRCAAGVAVMPQS